MRINDRSGKQYERIRLTDKNLEIYSYKPGDRGETLRTLSPYMLRVETVKGPEGHCEKLLLTSQGGSTEIGKFLSPDEKLNVAEDLRGVLQQASLPNHLKDAQPRPGA